MYCFSNSFFVVKCVFISLKILDHSFIQLKFFLLAMVDNLVTYIKSENFMDFTLEDGEDEFNSIKHLILSISL